MDMKVRVGVMTAIVAALAALGVTMIVVSVGYWELCWAAPTSIACYERMDSSGYLSYAPPMWLGALALTMAGIVVGPGRLGAVAGFFLLLVANPFFDPGLGVWDTADQVPGSGVIAGSAILVAALFIVIAAVLGMRPRRRVSKTIRTAPVMT